MKYVGREEFEWECELAQKALQKYSSGKKYNNEVVQNVLRQIYHGCCAYCEGKVEPTAYFEIEHYYPKKNKSHREYKQWVTEFKNLHYACPRCNRLKGNKDPKFYHILSPNYYFDNGGWVTKPNEIDSSLYYAGHKVFARTGSLQGEGTIAVFKLNERQSLWIDRLRKYAECYYLMNVIYGLLGKSSKEVKDLDSALQILFGQLVAYTNPDAAYSTMIVQNFGTEICKLMKVWQYKRNEKSICEQFRKRIMGIA